MLVLGAASAASAAAPPSISLTQFSKTVSGVAPTGVTGVVVNLLRNTINASGATVRNAVDTFGPVATGTTGAWSGAFTTHAVSTDSDEVEVNYLGGSGVRTPVTIGGDGSNFLPSAFAVSPTNGAPTTAVAFISWGTDDFGFDLSYTGKTLTCVDPSACSNGFTVAVNSGTPTSSGGTSSLNLSPAVSNTANLAITTQTTDSAGETINTTFPGPQLGVEELPLTGSYNIQPQTKPITGVPSCQAYLVLNELTCSGLAPGNYTVSNGTTSLPAAVPAATAIDDTTGDGNQTLHVPSHLGVTIPGLAATQQVKVTPILTTGNTGVTGSLPVTTLTVQKLTVGSSTPLGDLLNGANTTVVGGCSAGLFFNDDGPDLCGTTGAIGTPNNLAGSNPVMEDDDTSLGSTNVLMPTIPQGSQAPQQGDSIMTPYNVVALPRYTDPLAIVAAENAVPPQVGPAPIVPSVPSADPVTFSYAPIGSSTFTPLGNVNAAGGVVLPASTPKGSYDGQFKTTDAAGDFVSFDIQFTVQGPSSAPAPAAPTCTAANKSTKVQFVRDFATIAKKKHHKAKKHHKKKKKKSKKATAQISCSSSSAGTRVVLQVTSGSSIIATGTGTITSASTSIKFKNLKKGKYGLTEIYYYANGQSSEGSHTLKVS